MELSNPKNDSDEDLRVMFLFDEIDYTVKSNIGKGAFGAVYEVEPLNEINEAIYAAKVVDIRPKEENTDLYKENLVLKQLEPKIGFPHVKKYVTQEKSEILIMEQLGSNLEENLKKCGGTFSLKTVLMIGYQAIERLKSLHNIGYIHRDIKPENFLIGSKGYGKKIIHLIDFGLSCPYLDENNRHILFEKHQHITGTLYYLSVYGHLGIQATRRDDLISLGFMLLYFFKGQLPWNNVEGSLKEKIIAIYQLKATLVFKNFCEKLPEEFINYFEYVLKLSFFEEPDYAFLQELFRKMMDNNGILNDGDFDWITKVDCISKGIDLHARKLSSLPASSYMKKNIELDSELLIISNK